MPSGGAGQSKEHRVTESDHLEDLNGGQVKYRVGHIGNAPGVINEHGLWEDLSPFMKRRAHWLAKSNDKAPMKDQAVLHYRGHYEQEAKAGGIVQIVRGIGTVDGHTVHADIDEDGQVYGMAIAPGSVQKVRSGEPLSSPLHTEWVLAEPGHRSPIYADAGDVEPMREALDIHPYVFAGLAGAIVCQLDPMSPDPVIALEGGAGCGKSTLADVAVKTIDPAYSGRSGLTRDSTDTEVGLEQNAVYLADNVGKVSAEVSNILCRAVDQAGHGRRRQKYSDGTMYERPWTPHVVLTALEVEFAVDLLSRSVIIKPEAATNERSSDVINAAVAEALPAFRRWCAETAASAPEGNEPPDATRAGATRWGRVTVVLRHVAEVLGMDPDDFAAQMAEDLAETAAQTAPEAWRVLEHYLKKKLVEPGLESHVVTVPQLIEHLRWLSNHNGDLSYLINTLPKETKGGLKDMGNLLNECKPFMRAMGVSVGRTRPLDPVTGKRVWSKVFTYTKPTAR